MNSRRRHVREYSKDSQGTQSGKATHAGKATHVVKNTSRVTSVPRSQGIIKVVSEESASLALVAALDKCFQMTAHKKGGDFSEGGVSSKDKFHSRDGQSPGKAESLGKSGTLKKSKIRRRDSSQSLKDYDNCDGEDGHSSLKKKKTRKARKHCDIHSKSSRDNLAKLDNDSVEGDKISELVCTCHKRSKSKSRRPDPEGGITPVHLSGLDEYEKIIYDTEPLFSDIDDNPELEETIKKDVERYHKRVQNPDIFAAALMVNSNTMLKFAIIGTELQNINNSALRRVMFLSR